MGTKSILGSNMATINLQTKLRYKELLWTVSKVHPAKFRGVHKYTFYLHIKKCYNCRNKNIYLILLKNPLK
jgi:transposase